MLSRYVGSDSFWIILRQFQFALLFPAALLFLHSTYAAYWWSQWQWWWWSLSSLLQLSPLSQHCHHCHHHYPHHLKVIRLYCVYKRTINTYIQSQHNCYFTHKTTQLHVSATVNSHHQADHIKSNRLQLHWWFVISNITNVLLYNIYDKQICSIINQNWYI